MLGIGERSERLCAPRTTVYEHRGDHWVVRCPDRPDYHWGNYLALAAPPRADGLAAWADRHREAFAGADGVERACVGWETAGPREPAGLRAAAEAAGLGLEVVEALALVEPVPWTARVQIEVRPVPEDGWEELLAFCDTRGDVEAAGFRRWRYAHYSELVRDGTGALWGAWRDGALVGAAGVFAAGGIARFQDVGVAEAHRGLGICSQLIAAMTLDVAGRAETVLILADRGSQAERIYRRLGYDRLATVWGVTGPFAPEG